MITCSSPFSPFRTTLRPSTSGPSFHRSKRDYILCAHNKNKFCALIGTHSSVRDEDGLVPRTSGYPDPNESSGKQESIRIRKRPRSWRVPVEALN